MILLALLASTMTPAVEQAAASNVAGESHVTVALPSAVARRTDRRPEMEIVVWYPGVSGAPERPVVIGPPGSPFFEVAAVAPDAPSRPGRHPVILLSHGFGGSAEGMGWLAAPLARAGYVVISVDHPGNNALDKTEAGAAAWWERPRDMIAALHATARDRRLGPLMDLDRIGAAGFSMGGTTALALGGARIDTDAFDKFCRSHPDDGVCRPPAEMPGTQSVNLVATLERLGLTAAAFRAWEGTALPRVRAVLSVAPNARALDPSSLRRMSVPTVLIGGGEDMVVPIDGHARFASRAIRGARLIEVPSAAHYSFLATCTDAGRKAIDVCRMAPDQSTAHRVVIAEALRLFGKFLPVRR